MTKNDQKWPNNQQTTNVLNHLFSFFRGLWTKSNEEWEEVAIKMLKDYNDPALEEEIEKELNMIGRLNHENIVRIYGAFNVADTGNRAFAMEFVREGSLDNYLRTHKNHIKIPQQLFIFADNICEGMICLSRKGLFISKNIK